MTTRKTLSHTLPRTSLDNLPSETLLVESSPTDRRPCRRKIRLKKYTQYQRIFMTSLMTRMRCKYIQGKPAYAPSLSTNLWVGESCRYCWTRRYDTWALGRYTSQSKITRLFHRIIHIGYSHQHCPDNIDRFFLFFLVLIWPLLKD